MIMAFIITVVVLWLMSKIFMPLLYPRPPVQGKVSAMPAGQICEFCGGSIGQGSVQVKKRYFCSSEHAERFFG